MRCGSVRMQIENNFLSENLSSTGQLYSPLRRVEFLALDIHDYVGLAPSPSLFLEKVPSRE